MRYLEDNYDKMIGRSYRYVQQDHSLPEWGVVKALYEKNYVQSTDTTQRIPKKIHQIWLGSDLPGKYRGYVETWKRLHPDWEHKLWTDNDLDDLVMEKRDIFNYATNLGQKSDILRYEIVRQHGGIYVDTDFECLKPFDDLLYLDFFVGIAYDKNLLLYCGLFGSTPNNPIITRCVEGITEMYNGNDGNEIMRITGPEHITRSVMAKVTKDTEGVVAFPMDFFYPFPNNVRFTDNAYTYIRECSYAVHHWKTSWL